jgi:hypothetical protein
VRSGTIHPAAAMAALTFTLVSGSTVAGGRRTDAHRGTRQAGIQTRRTCPGGIDVYRRKLAELDSRIGELESLRDRVARELRQLEAGVGPGKEATG